MENLILLLTASLVWIKSAKKFKKTYVGNRGQSVLFAPGAMFERNICGGDEIYFSEHQENFLSYGVLLAQLEEKLELEDASEMLNIYLNRLRKPFKVPYHTGITHCPSDLVELEDYWQDEDQVDWKIKAYSNGTTMAILYVKNQ